MGYLRVSCRIGLVCITLFAVAGGCVKPVEYTIPDTPYAPERFSEMELSFPKEQRRTYTLPNGHEKVYLVQEPEQEPPQEAAILIYMHHALTQEGQGMDQWYCDSSFGRLRTFLAQRKWIYVCPRDAEFVGLLQDLETHYGERRVYLSGASQGGRDVCIEVLRRPSAYAGMILMCPAIHYPSATFAGLEKIHLPVWIVSGTKDVLIHTSCVEWVKRMRRHSSRVSFVEIPGGKHGAPSRDIHWDQALDFVSAQ